MNDLNYFVEMAIRYLEALLCESVLWATVSPLEWKRYETLRNTLIAGVLEKADIDDDVRLFLRSSNTIWGQQGPYEQWKSMMASAVHDPDMREAFVILAKNIMEDS